MIINKIRFNNYRVYYGETIFEFPISGERNISIIFADNDVGKTSFFMGILFCLYGTKDDTALSDLINVNAQYEKNYSASVSIFAEHGSDKIEITRSVELRGKVSGLPKKTDYKTVLTVVKNGIPVTTQEEEKIDYINSLIHQDAAQYFFFDGEKINDYSLASGSKDSTKYKDAIARILGIKEIDNAIEDLQILRNDYEKDRDAWIKKQGQHQTILQEKEEIARVVEDESTLIAKYDSEISAADERIRRFEDKLKDLSSPKNIIINLGFNDLHCQGTPKAVQLRRIKFLKLLIKIILLNQMIINHVLCIIQMILKYQSKDHKLLIFLIFLMLLQKSLRLTINKLLVVLISYQKM